MSKDKDLTAAVRSRGYIRASVTKLRNKIDDLDTTPTLAQYDMFVQKLESYRSQLWEADNEVLNIACKLEKKLKIQLTPYKVSVSIMRISYVHH